MIDESMHALACTALSYSCKSVFTLVKMFMKWVTELQWSS